MWTTSFIKPKKKNKNRNTWYRGNRKLFTSGCTRSSIHKHRTTHSCGMTKWPNHTIKQAMSTRFLRINWISMWETNHTQSQKYLTCLNWKTMWCWMHRWVQSTSSENQIKGLNIHPWNKIQNQWIMEDITHCTDEGIKNIDTEITRY